MRKMIWVLDDAKATLLIQQGASVREVAERLNVSRQTVYVAIRKGRIPGPAHGGPRSDGMPQDATPPNAACAGSTCNQP